MFKFDGKFGRIMVSVFDFLLLNIIFLLLSIPIITIGANLSAMYSVSFQIIKKNESSVYKMYFRSFKENLKQATICWSILLSIILILLLNLNIMGQTDELGRVVVASTILFLVLSIVYSLYLFPLISKFQNTLYELVKNALLLAVGYLPYTILLFVVNFGPMVIVYKWLPSLYIIFVYFYFLIGIATTIYVNAYIFNRIFDKMLEAKGSLTSKVNR